MKKLTLNLEHETESPPAADVIVIERTVGGKKTRIEIPKGIEAGLVVKIVQSVLTV